MIACDFLRNVFFRKTIAVVLVAAISFLFDSCGTMLAGKVRNPMIPAGNPSFSKEKVLLGELTALKSDFDVHFYGLDLQLLPRKKSVEGWVEIGATAVHDLNMIQIDLDQRMDLKELRWKSRDGQKLSFTRKYRAVYVTLPETIEQDESFSIHVSYAGKPPVARKPPWKGGFIWKKDQAGNDFAGVACQSEGASIWFPCKDHTSDEADSVHLKFTIPDNGLMVVSNGQFKGSEKKEGLQSFNWKVSYPINTYNITFYLGDYVKIEDKYTGISGKDLELNHYVLKPDESKARKHFQQLKDQLAIYEKIFGEYPWYEDGFKLVESPYEGMEHQTAIAYGNGFYNDLNGRDDYIILHETGHEWFGNAITAADLGDVWLQEGMATFGEVLYLEEKYGWQEAKEHLLDYRRYIKNRRAMVGIYERRYFDDKNSDVYYKGAWVLHTLRNQIGNDSVFFAVLRNFYNENKLKLTDTKTFIATVNKVTGKDYQWFFDQYLYQRKVPVIEYYVSSDAYLYYRWTAVSDPKVFNQFKVLVKNVKTHDRFQIVPNETVQRIKLPEGFAENGAIDDQAGLFGRRFKKKLEKEFVAVSHNIT